MTAIDETTLKNNADALAKAAQQLGIAANEIAPTFVSQTRGALDFLLGDMSKMSLDQARKRSVGMGIGVAVLGVAVGAAVVGHLLFHAKAVKGYGEYKKVLASQEKADRDAKSFIQMASKFCSAGDFEAAYAKGAGASDAIASVDTPGCFVLLTFGEEVDVDDFGAYESVYVGATKSMADAVHRHLSGEGNPYVKCDLECEKHVYALFYPCEEYELYSLKERLMTTLGTAGKAQRTGLVAQLD